MRLADIVFRGGHLSEQALVAAVMTGERPGHLERCDLCAERAVDLGRWLDQVRATGTEAADAAFPPERLLAQQQQILRRLEQLDQPARVIAFPNQYALSRDMGGRRVAAGWVAVAAAAGVLLGVISSQAAVRLTGRGASQPSAVTAAVQPANPPVADATPDAPAVSPAAVDENPALVQELDRSLPTSMMAWAGARQVRASLITLTPVAGGGK